MGKRIKEVKKLVEEFANTQGHNKCWFYPDIFNKLAKLLNIPIKQAAISRSEFEAGCKQYQDEIFGKKETLEEILNPLPPLPQLALYQYKDKIFWSVEQSCSHIRDLTNGCLREKYGLKLLGVREPDGTISPAQPVVMFAH